MSLNVRLHNMVCFPVPMVGLAGPPREPSSNVLFNQGTKIHPKHGLWVTQLFLLKKGKPNGQNSDDVTHHRQYEQCLWV